MNKQELTYWRIHDYLKGKMKGNDLVQFENELNTNESLKDEVEMHRLANSLIINNRLNTAKQTSLDIQKEYKKGSFSAKYIIGGLVLIGTLVGTYFFNKTTNNQPKTTEVQESNKIESQPKSAIQLETKPVEKVISRKETFKQAKLKPTEATETSIPTAPVSISNPIEKPVVQTENTSKAEQASASESIVQKLIVQADPCDGIKISASTSSLGTCKGEETGAIYISDIKGGSIPYKTEIVSAKENIKMANKLLPSGKYNVLISDKNNCSTLIENVPVKAIECDSKEEVFNPFIGEHLTLPVHHSKTTFVVYDKTGALYFKQSINANETFEWNGQSLNGETETGHFAYEIIYEDGSKKHNTLTITQ
jgi:hypothetical protein